MDKEQTKMFETLSSELLQTNLAANRKEAEKMAKEMLTDVLEEMAM